MLTKAVNLLHLGKNSVLKVNQCNLFSCLAIAYTVRVATGDQEDAGTNARAYIVLIGTQAASEKIYLELFQKEGFTPGLTETFSVEAVDVGTVMKLEIGKKTFEILRVTAAEILGFECQGC